MPEIADDGLREMAKALYESDFPNGDWSQFAPGHTAYERYLRLAGVRFTITPEAVEAAAGARIAFWHELLGHQPRAEFNDMCPPSRVSEINRALTAALNTTAKGK